MTITSTQPAHPRQLQTWQRQVAASLTPSERPIVKLLPKGLPNQEIARALYLSENTVKTHLQRVGKRLRPFATNAGVVSLNRTGMAILCMRAGVVGDFRSTGWALEMLQSLSSIERSQLLQLANESLGELPARNAEALAPSSKRQLADLSEKLEPYAKAAGVKHLDANGMAEMLVRSRVVCTSEMRQEWRKSVQRQVSRRERDVLALIVRGYSNQEAGDRLNLAPLTIKSHLARVAPRLTPYASAIGIVCPGDRTALATLAVLAGLDTKSK